MPIAAFTKLIELYRAGKLVSNYVETWAALSEIGKWLLPSIFGKSSTPGVLRSTAVPTDDEAMAMLESLAATPADAEAAISLDTLLKLWSWISSLISRFGG